MKESMGYMFEAGFLGTRAPFFMDFVTLIVTFLPIIVLASIILARKKHYKLHALTQNIIFIAAVVVLGYFELGVRVGGGFDAFMQDSGVSHTYASVVLGLHILVAFVMLFYWVLTVLNANIQFAKGLIPGVQSRSHKLLAAKTYMAIIFTSFSGIWVYLLLFVY
jgi:putative membrane protein